MAELIVKSHGVNKSLELVDGKPLFIGRSVECDIYLPSRGVSRRHAILMSRNGLTAIKDLGSSNGTYLNGKQIHNTMRLRNGDVVQVAAYAIEFHDASKSSRLRTRSERKTLRRTKRTVVMAKEPEAGAVDSAPAAEEFAQEPIAAASGHDNFLSFLEDPAGAAELDLADAVASLPDISETPPGGSLAGEGDVSLGETVQDSAPPTEPETDFYAEVEPEAEPELEHALDFADGANADEAILADEDGDNADADEELADPEEYEADDEDDSGEIQDIDEEMTKAQTVAETDGGQPAGAAEPVHEHPSGRLPVSPSFRTAIEARLNLYSILSDLFRERAKFLAERPKMAEGVKSELARQDREMQKMPAAEQAEAMIEKRKAKRQEIREAIQKARQAGEKGPNPPSKDMRRAEDLSISQWTFIAQSQRESLPAVAAAAYETIKTEPLALDLDQAGVDHQELFAGAAYYLALEGMLEEAKAERLEFRKQMAALAEKSPDQKRGVLGFFGGGKQSDEEADRRDSDGEMERLAEEENSRADRASWIELEMSVFEKKLIASFWKVYEEAAVHFIAPEDAPAMPMSVRAFLRHGVLGWSPWWMSAHVKIVLQKDCSDDIVLHMQVSGKITNILYADEYISAVANLECTPGLDENLEINERNSPNWKADKALRRLVNARSQKTLLTELRENLTARNENLNTQIAELDKKIAALIPGQKNFKQLKNEFSQTRQGLKVEASKLAKLSEKLKEETLATLEESIAEVEERLNSGELPKPTREFLVRRECGAVHKIARLLANLKERFMPLVIRDSYQPDTDAHNDRKALEVEFRDIENRDPGVFLKILVPHKKKANRVDLRISPVIAILPAAGLLCYSWNPRSGPEDGRLAIPTCFIRQRLRERQLAYLISDFRWDTSKADAGMDVMTSETIVAAFMTVRWDWRKRSKEGREKGMIYTDQNDRTNWRRVYEAYLQTAYDSGKKLYNRNYDFYERIFCKYFDFPEGVEKLRK